MRLAAPLALLIAASLLSACAAHRDDALPALERALAAQDSATAALGAWCHMRGIADPPLVTAQRITGADLPPSSRIRKLLEARPGEAIAYRHVRLSCGSSALSVAHNWYLPARLTPEMNRVLETGDTPFGRVVAPLGFTRQRLATTHGRAAGCPDGTILSHRAVLKLPDGQPISAVIECYTAANLVKR